MAANKTRHDHVQTLGTLKSIATGSKIPFRYLRRLSLMPGFPQPYRHDYMALDKITTADYLYSRQAVREYLAEHLAELPQDDASGYSSVQIHLKPKRTTKGRQQKCQ